MQTEQVDKSLISRRHRLSQRRSQSETREHLHQIVVRRVQPQRQTLQTRDLLPRLLVISPLLVTGVHTRGRRSAGERVRDGHVERAEGGDFARLSDARAAACGSEPADRVRDAIDRFLEDAVGRGDPGG